MADLTRAWRLRIVLATQDHDCPRPDLVAIPAGFPLAITCRCGAIRGRARSHTPVR